MEFIREKQTSIVAILTCLKVDIWYEHIYSTQPELSCFARFFILYIIWFLLQILIKTSDKNQFFRSATSSFILHLSSFLNFPRYKLHTMLKQKFSANSSLRITLLVKKNYLMTVKFICLAFLQINLKKWEQTWFLRLVIQSKIVQRQRWFIQLLGAFLCLNNSKTVLSRGYWDHLSDHSNK